MENATEDDRSSSMANHSLSGTGDGCSAASVESSGWTTYIDHFMETRQQHKEASSACTTTTTPSSTADHGGSTSEHGTGDHGAGSGAVASSAMASMLPALVDPSQVSKRLGLIRKKGGIGRKKKLLYDESLEDTATSPIRSPKLVDSGDSNEKKHKKKENGSDEISHSKNLQNTADELDCDNHIINNNGEKSSTDIISDDAYDHNELRKKGLCLVPVNVFHL